MEYDTKNIYNKFSNMYLSPFLSLSFSLYFLSLLFLGRAKSYASVKIFSRGFKSLLRYMSIKQVLTSTNVFHSYNQPTIELS